VPDQRVLQDRAQAAFGPVLVSSGALEHRVAELGEEISGDYLDRDLIMVGVLKGAVVFFADLLRKVSIPCEVDFMAVSSYGSGTSSSGVVRIEKDVGVPVEGKDILIVEDIVESGLTLSYVMRHLAAGGPRSLKACALLAKKSGSRPELRPSYVGFDIPDLFAVGYGLDYAERFRNLSYVASLKPAPD
jgi:hypoxanthine phosphoribosyltransferase